MILIAGLGNPGPEYEKTRHNMGFRVVEDFALRHSLHFKTTKHEGLVATMGRGQDKILVVKPMTYMNDSGRCLQSLAAFYKIPCENILVIYDDIDLPFGKLRLRQKGSGGTHNGMRSVILELGTGDFNRIRVGVGAPPPGWELKNYVLGQMTQEEETGIAPTIKAASEAVDVFVEQGMEKAMQLYNANDKMP